MALVRITIEYAAQIRVRGSMDPRCIIRDLQNYAFLRIHAACTTWLDKDTFKAQFAVHALFRRSIAKNHIGETESHFLRWIIKIWRKRDTPTIPLVARSPFITNVRIEISRVILGVVFHRELLALTRRKIESKEMIYESSLWINRRWIIEQK